MSTPVAVKLTKADRKELEGMMRGGKHSARVLKRAQILLMADINGAKPRTQGEIVTALGISVTTVSATSRRYGLEGLAAGLGERPRPPKTPKITGEMEARLIALACSDAPTGYARWTLRLLANEMVRLEYVDSISHTEVADRLKKMKLSLGK